MATKRKLAGVDEAGKGPVIGPMVVCGVAAESGEFEELRRLGVKDSKALSRSRREELYSEIVERCEVKIRVIEADELNELMNDLTINEILYQTYSGIISSLKPDLAYVDSSDVNSERLSRRLSEETGIEVIAMHKADSKRVEVAAASIVAKVVRDRRIDEIKEELGEFGSGYASDPRTVEFLKEYYRKNGHFPGHVRLKWKTLSRIVEEVSQRTLFEF